MRQITSGSANPYNGADMAKLRFEDLSALQWSALTLGTQEPWDALVLEFSGEYGYGCKGNDDGGFMEAVSTLARGLWPARNRVVDLRRLSYQWGDWISSALGGDRVAIVVSDLCREGLTSLVKQEMGRNPSETLFDSLEQAFQALGIHAEPRSLTRRSVDDPRPVRVSLERVPLGPDSYDQALLVSLEGKWNASQSGAVKAFAKAGLRAMTFTAIIFDVRDVQDLQESGLDDVLVLGRPELQEERLLRRIFGMAGDGGWPGRKLTAVIASDIQRESLASCLARSKFPAEGVLFESLEQAVGALRARDRSLGGFSDLIDFEAQ